MKNTHITSLSLESFKGRTRTHQFQPGVNLIVGPNGSGKTSISEAISFVFAGKVPGLPATNGGLMSALGSGLSMGASLDIGGKTYDRSLTRSGKSVTSKAKQPAPADLVPSPMLDLGPFLEASPKARASMILGACGDDVPAKLRALLAETGLEKLTGRPTASDDVQEWLADVDALAKVTASGYTRSIAEMKATLSGMEILDTSAPAPSGPPLSELRANVSRLEREIATLTGEANAIAARPSPAQPPGERPNGTAEAFETQLAEAQTKLRQAQADLAQAQADRQAWDRWDAERSRLEAKLAESQAAYQVVADGWEAVDEVKVKAEIQELTTQYAGIKHQINAAKADVLTGKTECQCCGAKAEHWNRPSVDWSEVTVLEGVASRCDSRMAELNAILTQAAAVSRASEAVLRASQALTDHAKQGQGLAQVDDDLYAGIVDDLTETADSLAAEARRARAWDAYDLAAKEHFPAMERMLDINVRVLPSYKATLDAYLADLHTAEAAHAAQAQAEARQATRRQAEARLARLEADETAFKAARLAWQEGVQAIMDGALREVLKVCEVFTAGLFAAPLTVHELQLGVYQDATWIPIDAFSGSDRRIACAAIQAALAANHQGFKLAIIDEATTIDPERLPKVLVNLVKACDDGLIDQALIMSNATVQNVPSKVNVIRLV